MINIQGLTKVFKGVLGPSFTAVDNISFEVKKKDIFGFLGPNGAGKTTTIKMLTTILSPTQGTATIKGFDVIKNQNEVKRHIGFMPEKPGFYEQMNPLGLLSFYGKFYGMNRSLIKDRSKELLELTGIYEFRKRKVKNFSHGMRKRVALCQALMHDPEVLILDEPTGGLDPAGTHEFRDLLRVLQGEGKTIFLSSHLLSEVQQICNRVGIINKGQIVDVGTIEDIQKHAGLKNSFVTIKGKGFKDDILEEIADLKGVSYIKPSGTKNRQFLTIYLETPSKGVIDNVCSEAVQILVSNKAKVNSVLPPESDLEEAFLAIITKNHQGGDDDE